MSTDAIRWLTPIRTSGMNVRWSCKAANSILEHSRSVILPNGTRIPRETALDTWTRLTDGYTL